MLITMITNYINVLIIETFKYYSSILFNMDKKGIICEHCGVLTRPKHFVIMTSTDFETITHYLCGDCYKLIGDLFALKIV